MPTGDKPNSSRASASNRTTGEARGSQDDPTQTSSGTPEQGVDFGSYVSSTVRSSAELFGTPARSAPTRRTRQESTRSESAEERAVVEEPATSTYEPAEPRERLASPGPEASRGRSSRRWRDLASGAPVDDVGPEPEPEDDGDGGGGFDLKSRIPWGFGDDGRPKWVVWGGIALAILAAILLIWFLLGREGDNKNEGDTTPTSESVIDAPDMDGNDGTPPAFSSTEESEQTPTSQPQRGGDNQRDRDTEGTPEGSVGDPLEGIELGPVASQCEERCLVRIADGGDAATWMLDARTRPSYAAEGWIWTVASPEGIAWFEQNTETTLVSETADTLNLYVAWVPGEEADSDRVGNIGTVLDSAGSYRVFAADSIPANVRPLTDWGYTVEKVAPAPPLEIANVEEPMDIQTVEVGSLMNDVSAGNIESSIMDLIGMGSHDGSGVGTRYYTSAANTAAAEYLFSRLEAYGLTVWYEDFLTWEGYLVVNVIGEVPGSDDSEIYGVMAHFDTISTDLTNAPGADDNATGVSASLEIARVLSEYDLVHPVRIIFVNVEEVGIIGSQVFARNAAENSIPYKGVFNLDSIGAQRQYSYVVVNGDSSTTWMTDLFRQMNEAYGLNQTINAMTNDAIVADDNRLRESGIDSIMIGRELYGQSPYHHTPEDLFPTLSMLGVERLTQLTLISVAYLAQGQ